MKHKKISLDHAVVLLGFKHVGKSVIGKALSIQLKRKFIDLDYQIEYIFEQEYQKKQSCRQMMKEQGEVFFRNLEARVLKEVLSQSKNCVIALGGGAPVKKENQLLLKSCLCVHITAPFERVFKRIIAKGKPAFVSPKKEAKEVLNLLWQKREKIYRKLADVTIENDQDISSTIKKILLEIHA